MTKQSNITAVDSIHLAAGGGLLDRRTLLSGALLGGAAGLVPPPSSQAQAGAANANGALGQVPPWQTKPGGPFTGYGVPSKWQESVQRIVPKIEGFDRVGASRTPIEMLEGTITPNGLHFDRNHNGVPDIDPSQHELVIHGRVKRALSFSYEDLMRYPMRSITAFVECGGNSGGNARPEPQQATAGGIHGLVSAAQWTGIPLSVLLDEVGVEVDATWILAEGADAATMSRSIPIWKCREDAMVALYQNGEAIRPEQGFPMRLLLPGFEGNTNVKWLHRLMARTGPAQTRDETSHYTDLLKTGKARQFVLRTRVKSVITKPSFGLSLKGPGLYEISGLAWTGGRIAKVEVSADGGKSWTQAAFDAPPLVNALSRFRLPWQWDGRPSVLMSRATDEEGNVQPTRDQFLADIAPGQAYHFNAIQAWGVSADGALSNVYV